MNKSIKYFYVFVLISILLFACGDEKDKYLNYSLNFAGENRVELEKVLDHYKDEPKKLAAARFLIENMPHYYFYRGWQIDSIKSLLSKETKKRHLYALNSLIIENESINRWKKFSYYNSCEKIYDSHVITADYLIKNIDIAFLVWEKYPWNKNLTFDDFCELILPYRISDEPLESWRENYYNYYSRILDSLYNGKDIIEACDIISNLLNQEQFIQNKDFELPHLGANFLFENRVGYCRDACDHIIYTMRSIGIPVAMDSYIYSPENRLGHSWNVVRDTTGKYLLTGYYIFDNKRETRDDGRKKGKVYRNCFGVQKKQTDALFSTPFIPVRFKNPFSKDVTSDYFEENSLQVKLNDLKSEYAFLSVFSIYGWEPIALSKTKKEITFHNVEPNLIYHVLTIDKGGIIKNNGYPFLFKKENIHYFIPDTANIKEVSIKRKYPLRFYTVISLNENMIGASIWGSNNLSFDKATLLHKITDSIFINRNILNFEEALKYSYIRYQAPAGKKLELAEFCLYEDIHSETPLSVHIVDSFIPVHPQRNDFAISNILDGNPLSFTVSKDTSAHITFQIEPNKKIKKIMFVPRNDENFIWPGDQYELLFHNGIQGWKSLGKQIAKESEIKFSVPDNALLWLRNLTRGQEEQIFYIKDGKQVFCSDINP